MGGRAIGRARRAGRVRTGLLVSSSVAAIVTLCSSAAAENAAPPADQPKWSPYLSLGGLAGDQANNGLAGFAFAPVWQDLNSLLYVRLGFGTRTRTGLISDMGIGYRTKLTNEWIGGIYGGFDSTRTRSGNTFTQGSIGAEAMSADWDVRLNGYLAQSQPRGIPGNFGLVIRDTQIAILHGQEQAYSGVSGEVGYRVFNTDDIDVRVLAGGFSFSNSNPNSINLGGQNFNFGSRDMVGPLGRAEVDLYNINLFGRTSRLTVSGQVSHDDVRGTSGFVGALLQVSVGGPDGSEDGDELDRRMVDPVRRQDYVLTERGASKPEPVIIYDNTFASQPTNTLYYVDNSAGTGSYADPTTLHDATSRGPHNQFIVLTDKEGSVNASGVNVQQGETVSGPGTFKVRGVDSHEVFTHTFAPGSGPASVNTTDGITVGNNTVLHGFTLTGSFPNGIYGHNVDGVHISGVTIHGGGTSTNGIYFHEDNGGSAHITIDNTTIDGVTQDGIKLNVQNATGSTAVTSFNLTGVTASAGQYGVLMDATISGGSHETNYLGVHNSTLSGGTTDLAANGTVAVGSSLSQTVLVDPTFITGGNYGIVINGAANGGTLTQTVGIDHVYITGALVTGLKIDAQATAGGSVTQNVHLSAVTSYGADALDAGAYGSGGNVTQSITGDALNLQGGIHVVATSDGGAATQQLVDLGHSAFNGAGAEIYVLANGSATGSVTQGFYLTNTSGSGGTLSDIYVGANAYDTAVVQQSVGLNSLNAATGSVYISGYAGQGTLTQAVSLSNVDVSGGAYVAFAVSAEADNFGSLNQTIMLDQIAVTGSYYPIVFLAGADNGAKVTQVVTATHVSASGGIYDNITFTAYSRYGGTDHQYATLTDVTAINSRYGYGLVIDGEALENATTIQRVSVDGLTATGNYDGGVALSAGAANYSLGATAVTAQYVALNDATIAGNGGAGVFAVTGGIYDSAARQDLSIQNSVLDNNAGPGLEALAEAIFYGSSQQYVSLLYDDVSHNGADGAAIAALAFDLGSTQQNVYILGSTFNDNAGDGILITANAIDAGQALQNVGIYNATATGNGVDGVSISTSANGYAIGTYAYYSHVGQNVIAYNNDISHNARNGVEIQNYAGYGAQVNQFVYLYGNHLDYNGPTSGPVPPGAGNGLYEKSTSEAYGSSGGAILTNIYSDVYVINGTASHNVVDGLRFKGSQDGPGYLIQHLTVAGTDASYNGRTGFVAYANATNFYSLNIQYISLANSTFDHNGLDGAAFLAFQSYGPLSFGAAIQDVTVTGSDFSNNPRDGFYAYATATDFQGRAEQHFTIGYSTFDHNGLDGATFKNYAHDGAYYPGYPCTTAQGLTGGCAFVRETVQIVASDFSHNGNDGIYVFSHAANYGAVYDASGRPSSPTLLTEYVTADNNGGDGLHLENGAVNNSYVFSYAVLLGSHFDNNAVDGIYVHSQADAGSTIVQGTILYSLPGSPTTADGNGGTGVHIVSTATGGTVQQLIGVYYADVSNNHDTGISVYARANDSSPLNSVVAQYVSVVASVVDGNSGGYGVAVAATAGGPYAVTQQQVEIVYSDVSYNFLGGVSAAADAFSAASANQYLLFGSDLVTNNGGDGIHVASVAQSLGSIQQTLTFNAYASSVSYIAGNGGDGIYLGTSAFSAGITQQNAFLYSVNASGNTGNGLEIAANTNGYGFGYVIYYSHISQNVIAAGDTFDGNQLAGVQVGDIAYYGGAMNQFLYFLNVDASHNTTAGFYMKSSLTAMRGNSFAFSTNISTDLYLINSSLDHNGAAGVDLRSYNYGPVYAPAFFGGYSYLVQHNIITGTEATYNGTAGLSVSTNAQGRYGLNAQYFTIDGATFDHNTGAGARFTSSDYYGPGGFGDTFQQITISNSSFSHNGADGLDLLALATGRQGRAEQHVTITASYLDHNGGDGLHVYASATNGVYVATFPCTVVQGLSGGCAFVRQNVDVFGSDMSYNAGNGAFVGTYANHYGAIYGASGRPHAPTLELYGATVGHNGGRGLDISNHVSGSSYLYQYNAAIDTHFDHNASDGVYAASYIGGGSTMLQRNLVYTYHTGASASYNAGNGFKSTIEALGGSYARDVNVVEGAGFSHDGAFGIDGAVAYADGTSTGLQINAIYFDGINYNGDGIGLYSIGPGSQQISYIGGDHVHFNAFVGVYGEANFGAFQYIGVYSFGNYVSGNGTDYLFNAFGGATQILN